MAAGEPCRLGDGWPLCEWGPRSSQRTCISICQVHFAGFWLLVSPNEAPVCLGFLVSTCLEL